MKIQRISLLIAFLGVFMVNTMVVSAYTNEITKRHYPNSNTNISMWAGLNKKTASGFCHIYGSGGMEKCTVNFSTNNYGTWYSKDHSQFAEDVDYTDHKYKDFGSIDKARKAERAYVIVKNSSGVAIAMVGAGWSN